MIGTATKRVVCNCTAQSCCPDFSVDDAVVVDATVELAFVIARSEE